MSRSLPPDRVAVTGITAVGHHGVLAGEKRDGQQFSADVVLHVPIHRAGATDDLAAAVDYSVVAAAVHAILAGPSLDLVETLAERIAAAVLAEGRIGAVDVTVHKPQAPVGVPFGDVTVQIHRTRADVAVSATPLAPVPVVLALGANLGDRAASLASAVLTLGRTAGMTVDTVSPVVETGPVGGPDQPPYLNAVVLATTTLSARALLHAVQDVETAHARTHEVRWGPRTLDVDVVGYGDLVLRTGDLTLPHPRAATRAFVLRPWLLADPDAVLPAAHGARPVSALLARLDVGPEDLFVCDDLVLPGSTLPGSTLPGTGLPRSGG